MPKLKFYEVDAEYIRYLSAVDSRVPRIDYSESGRHDKFLCGIVLRVGGHNYFAPVSSFKTPQRSNFVIEDAKGNPVSSLRFSYMIPVPDSAVSLKDIGSEKPAYKNLLNLELRYINQNATAVFTRARYVYQLAVQKKDPIMVKNCCDFKALEDACAEYGRLTERQTQPEASDRPRIIKTADGLTSVTETIRAAQKEQRERPPSPKKTKYKNDPEL